MFAIRFFEKKLDQMVDKVEQSLYLKRLSEQDRLLLQEISEAIAYIKEYAPNKESLVSDKRRGQLLGDPDQEYLYDLRNSFISAFMQYSFSNPVYRFYRERLSKIENGFFYASPRKEKNWYIQAHPSVDFNDPKYKERDFFIENVSEIFEKLLRPILRRGVVREGSRGWYLLDSLRRSKAHFEEENTSKQRWLIVDHMNLPMYQAQHQHSAKTLLTEKSVSQESFQTSVTPGQTVENFSSLGTCVNP